MHGRGHRGVLLRVWTALMNVPDRTLICGLCRFPGIAAIASFTINGASPLGVTAFGSLFQIGWGFAIGIAFAIITCASTSGGHFNPAITICFAIWQGFPWRKVPHYIVSQIFGAFMAGLLLMGMYWPEIQAFKAESIASGKGLVYNGGPASILCSFPNPKQTCVDSKSVTSRLSTNCD